MSDKEEMELAVWSCFWLLETFKETVTVIAYKSQEIKSSFSSFKMQSHHSTYSGCETRLVTGEEDKSSLGLNPVQR